MKVYLSKSNLADSSRVNEVRLALSKDPNVTIVEHKTGSYTNQELLDSDMVFLVIPTSISSEESVYVGRGQYEQVKDAHSKEIPVFAVYKQDGIEDVDEIDIYFKEVVGHWEHGGDWQRSYGTLQMSGRNHNIDWSTARSKHSLPTALTSKLYPCRVKGTMIPTEKGPIPNFDNDARLPVSLLLCSTRILKS